MPHPSSVRPRCRVRSRCGARPGHHSLLACLVAALAVVLASASWLLIAPEVEARPQDRHGPYGAVVEASDGVAELGQFQLGDTTVWCIDLNSYGPQKASDWVTTRTDRIRKQTSFGDRAGHADVAGDLITREEMAELAWGLEWAENNVDDDATAIAVDHFIRLRSIGDQAQRTRMDNRLEAAAKEYPDVPDHLARLEERVDAEAGPFRMELKLDVAAGNGTAQVVGRAGKPIPGRVMTVTMGDQRVDVTSDSKGVATFDLPQLDSGEVNVSAEAVMPGSIPVLHTPRHYDDDTHGDHRIQRMLSAGEPAVVRARDSYRVGGSTPSVVTVASTPQARVGAELHDVVRVTGAAGYRGRATARLWGPFPDHPGERQCRDEQMKAGEVEFDVDGDGSYTTPNITVEKPGRYTWTVHLPQAPGFEGVDTPCGIEAETTEILAAPVVETDIDAGDATVGSDVRDRVHVSGLHEPGQLEATLWGPYESAPGAEQCRPDDPVAGRVSATVDGSGSTLTPAVRPTEPGFYVWTVRLTADGVDVITDCGDPRETAEITAASASPKTVDAEPAGSPTQAPSPTAQTPKTTTTASTTAEPMTPTPTSPVSPPAVPPSPSSKASQAPKVPTPESPTPRSPSADSRGSSPKPSGHRESSAPKPSASPGPETPNPETPAPENTDAPAHPTLEPEPEPEPEPSPSTSLGTAPPITSPTPLPRPEAPIRIRSGA